MAASAVVTKDVEPYTIVAGIPAKPLRKRFSEAEIRHLLEMRWWDKSVDEIRLLKEIFLSKSDWMRDLGESSAAHDAR